MIRRSRRRRASSSAAGVLTASRRGGWPQEPLQAILGPMPHTTFFATCPKTIEDLLVTELTEAGAARIKETVAGARFDGTLETAYRMCLWSRFASRILLPISEFPAASPGELLDGVRSISWDEHFDVDETFAVEGSTSDSNIRHSDYAALVVKDGIADYFRAKVGRRPNVEPRDPGVRISVRIVDNIATVNIDLSGESLHRRAYRIRGVAAPIKENVAAAMLARARWPEIVREGGTLLDPMCGSGTLLIEGALMAGDVAPGLLRLLTNEQRRATDGLLAGARELGGASRSHDGLSATRLSEFPQRWRGNDASVWRAVVLEAAERCLAGFSRIPDLVGFDHDGGAVAAARENAASAGLKAKITVERGELARLKAPSGPPGLVAVNPPYGERIGTEQPVEELYEELGRVLHDRFAGWRACVITSDERLSRSIGLRASKVNTLFNGPIRCVLAHFELSEGNRFIPRPVRPERSGGKQQAERTQAPTGAEERRDAGVSSRAARPLSARPLSKPRGAPEGGNSDATGGILSFINRIRKNRKILDKWAARSGISCYRIYDADLPEYAVAVDYFEGRWLHVQEYVAPSSIDADRAARRLEDIMTVLPDTIGVPPENVFLKRRKRQRRSEQYRKLAAKGEFYEVHEQDCSFLVNFTDYLDTGLFLDHRLTREKIRGAATGKSFLNLFAYTCTASVCAAKGGAISTTSVDSSNTYLRWARENFTANGIAGQQHRLLRADCWEWLHVDTERYDMIFMDPPTFSNAKGKRATLDVQRDHPKLIRLAANRLASGGTLIFSTNFRRFQIDSDAFADLEIEDITRETIPRDFSRNRRIHHCFRIRPRAGSGRGRKDGR